MYSRRTKKRDKAGKVQKSEQVDGLTATQLSKGLLVSICKVRKILGAEAKDISDDELEALVFMLTLLSQQVLAISFENNNGVTK